MIKLKSMKNKFAKAALLFGTALALSTSGLAQEESKLKVERGDYELKVKREGDEYKVKEKGALPQQRSTTIIREGRTITTVKSGALPKQEPVAAAKPVAKKRTYAAKKKCTCKPVARKSSATKKRAVAYRPKTKAKTTTAVAVSRPAPVIVRDTVMIVRVDTVFSMMEPAYYSGYRISEGRLPNGLKKLKIEHEDDGIEVTEEYYDGEKVKREFDNEHDLNTYMKWKYD